MDELKKTIGHLPLCYVKLCLLFQSHLWIKTGVTVQKFSIRVIFGNFLSCVTSKFVGWHFKFNRAPLLCCFKLCASCRSHQSIQTQVTVRKPPLWVKIGNFSPVWPQILQMTLKNNRTSLQCYFKLCASFHNHRWIPTQVTVRKRPIWVKLDDI